MRPGAGLADVGSPCCSDEVVTMPRAIWKGSLSFGLVNIPLGLYPAEKRKDLKFNMLDKRDFARVGYQRINKATGEPIEDSDNVVKGYEYAEDEYVVVTKEDFERANPELTKTVQIIDFVDADEIDPIYFDKPYYLAPTQGGDKGYALLRETLRRSNKIGVAKVVIRKKEYVAALSARGDVMVLDMLRFSEHLRDPGELDVPGDDLDAFDVTDKELDMADRLVQDMVVEWNPDEYHDEYTEQLRALIESKVESGETESAIPEEEEEESEGGKVVDIMSALKRSVEEKEQEEAA